MSGTTKSENKEKLDMYLHALSAQNKGESVNSQIVCISQEIISLMNQIKIQKKVVHKKYNRKKDNVNNSLILINLLLSGNRATNYYKSFGDLSDYEKNRIVNELNVIC